MSRNYRIICKEQKVKKRFEGLVPEKVYGLAEVYYDDNNQPNGWTEPDIWLGSVKEVISDLRMKLKDAEKRRRHVIEIKNNKIVKK